MNASAPLAGVISVDAVLTLLRRAPAPLTLDKLAKELRGRKPEEVSATVSEAVRQGVVHPWPKYRNKVRFWHRDAAGWIRECLLEAAQRRAMPAAGLVREAARRSFCSGAVTGNEVKQLRKEGALQSARIAGLTLLYRPGYAAALVAPVLDSVREQLRKKGVAERDILRALGAPIEAPEPVAAQPAMSLTDRILEAVRMLAAGPSIPVTVRALRGQLPAVSKADFDRAVLQLAADQRLYLTTHDHGWALADAEREELVHDGGQKLYVAVTLRD